MSAAHVQVLGTVSGLGTTTVIAPSGKTVTAGNTVIVGWVSYDNVTVSGITDNLGNTYVRVERNAQAYQYTDLWYAPITHAGSITAITISHPNSANGTGAIASEFSGVGTLSSVGAGTTGGVFVNSKTIPANGLAVGVVDNNVGSTLVVGSASGSPSTSISVSVQFIPALSYSFGLFYALAGSSAVTTFTG